MRNNVFEMDFVMGDVILWTDNAQRSSVDALLYYD